MRCLVDCRLDDKVDNDYLSLSLWGRPVYSYVVEACYESAAFDQIVVMTDSQRIADYCHNYYPNVLIVPSFPAFSEEVFIITGRAPCISPKTIRYAVEKFDETGGTIISSRRLSDSFFENKDLISFFSGYRECGFNAFCISRGITDERKFFFHVPDEEAVVVNSANDFELALVLKKKQNGRSFVVQMIDQIISDKVELFSTPFDAKSVCLVGHSQLDQWPTTEIAGYKVRNCAVSGISSFEYNEKIIEKGLLNCSANAFIVMHGTNDLVWKYTIDEMVISIKHNIDYLRQHNPGAPIIFISCMHVNGRLDRNNSRIDELNNALRASIESLVIWIDTSFMDNQYGCLDEAYTKDGLHISEIGYDLLKKKIEETMRGIGL